MQEDFVIGVVDLQSSCTHLTWVFFVVFFLKHKSKIGNSTTTAKETGSFTFILPKTFPPLL